jgi:hypothetical protein
MKTIGFYDIFDTLIHAREIQAKNQAVEMARLATENDMKIYIPSKDYEPGIDYLDSSYSIIAGN